MGKKYKVGDYEFDTYEEYLAAKEDVRKIDYITKAMDITDIDVAVRLYTLIRNKEIIFHSEIGVSFSWYLTDLTVNHSRNMLEEKHKKERQAQQGKRLKLAGMACIAAAVCCLGFYGMNLWQEHLEKLEYERLQDMQHMTGHLIWDPFIDGTRVDLDQPPDTDDDSGAGSGQKKTPEKKKKPAIDPADLAILKQYEDLYKQNKDMVGWLKIDGTNVNYPVLQTGTSDPAYYLHMDFNKKKSDSGSLFLDARNDFVNRDTNLIIYGHNMKDSSMFGGLHNYMQEDYFKTHQKLEFDTIYEKTKYKIVAVCLSKVRYQDDYAFRYYNFLNADNKEDFNAYLANVQQLAVVGQVTDISYGDELLTLSTCNNYTEGGRLFLIAKKE